MSQIIQKSLHRKLNWDGDWSSCDGAEYKKKTKDEFEHMYTLYMGLDVFTAAWSQPGHETDTDYFDGWQGSLLESPRKLNLCHLTVRKYMYLPLSLIHTMCLTL